MKVKVLRPYQGPNGWHREGELVDEHPATAAGLIRRGLAVECAAQGPRSFKPAFPTETKSTGADNPDASLPAPAAGQLSDAVVAPGAPPPVPPPGGSRAKQPRTKRGRKK